MAKASWGPSDYLGVGTLIYVLGAFCAGGLLYVAPWLGVLTFALTGVLGGVLLLIGAIAKGVQVAAAHPLVTQKPTSAIDPADAR